MKNVTLQWKSTPWQLTRDQHSGIKVPLSNSRQASSQKNCFCKCSCLLLHFMEISNILQVVAWSNFQLYLLILVFNMLMFCHKRINHILSQRIWQKLLQPFDQICQVFHPQKLSNTILGYITFCSRWKGFTFFTDYFVTAKVLGRKWLATMKLFTANKKQYTVVNRKIHKGLVCLEILYIQKTTQPILQLICVYIMLFSIYVNDIPLIVKSPVLLFADDTKIFRYIQCKDDYLQLQNDINKLL